jgi:hypothetical protein
MTDFSNFYHLLCAQVADNLLPKKLHRQVNSYFTQASHDLGNHVR